MTVEQGVSEPHAFITGADLTTKVRRCHEPNKEGITGLARGGGLEELGMEEWAKFSICLLPLVLRWCCSCGKEEDQIGGGCFCSEGRRSGTGSMNT